MPTFDSGLFDDQRFDGTPAAASVTAQGPFSAKIKLARKPVAKIRIK